MVNEEKSHSLQGTLDLILLELVVQSHYSMRQRTWFYWVFEPRGINLLLGSCHHFSYAPTISPACPTCFILPGTCSSRRSWSAHDLDLLHLASWSWWWVHLGLAAAAADAAAQGGTDDAKDNSGPTPGAQVHNDEADGIAQRRNVLRLHRVDAKYNRQQGPTTSGSNHNCVLWSAKNDLDRCMAKRRFSG